MKSTNARVHQKKPILREMSSTHILLEDYCSKGGEIARSKSLLFYIKLMLIFPFRILEFFCFKQKAQ